MAQNFRHSEILTIARESGKVTVEGLATRFKVTSQTIRRDLAELCDVGQLTRVHGGAMIPSGVIALGYEDRRSLASVEKDAMARLVAEQIPDGVSIFMNIGTTTEAVARALLKHRNLMVVSCTDSVENKYHNANTFNIDAHFLCATGMVTNTMHPHTKDVKVVDEHAKNGEHNCP
jgi:DeoR family glycerol-3-phosphate regulon repressor